MWSGKETDCLIRTVKKYPSIWDSEQFDKENKSHAWRAVVKEMGINHTDGREVRQKWKNLLFSFNDCLRKLQNLPLEKTGENNAPNFVIWRHFKKMQFLEPYIELDELLAEHAQRTIESQEFLSDNLSTSSSDCVIQEVKMESV